MLGFTHRFRFPLLLLFLAAISPMAIAQTAPAPLTATVVSVGDGDTLRASQGRQSMTLRLSCLDAPESNQPGGQASANRLRQLLPRGSAIQITPVDTDRYGRTIALVSSAGQSVNLQMVREGHAVVYQQFLNNCPTLRNALVAAEAEAKAAKRGFWSQARPIMPWDWRAGRR